MLVPSRRLFIAGIGSLIAAPALINHAMKLRGEPLDPWTVAFDLYEGPVRSQFDPVRNDWPFPDGSWADAIKDLTSMGAAQRVAYLNNSPIIGVKYKLVRQSELVPNPYG